jgi:hypothetical protein
MLVAGHVWAETLYVRPTSAEYGAEDGTSYAAAFDGLADVTWGVGVGNVSIGDTLVVCGTFGASDTDQVWTFIDLDVSGAIIDGDCSGNETNPESWVDKFGTTHSGAVFNGAGTVDYGVYCADATDCPSQTIKSLSIKNLISRGIYIRNALTAANPAGTVITDVKIEKVIGTVDPTPTGIWGTGSTATITRVIISNITDDSIHWDGDGLSVMDSTMVYPGYLASTNIGDCVQVANNYTDFLVQGSSCDHSNVTSKQCYIVSGGSAETNVRMRNNTCIFPLGDAGGFNVKPLYIEAATSGEISGNYVYGGWTGIWCASAVTVKSNIVVDASRAGIYCQGFTGTQTVANNTIQSTTGTDECLRVDGVNITMTVVNNAVNGNCDVAFVSNNAASRTWQYNDAFGYADLDTGFTTDGTNILTNPLFVGGTSPNTATGFRLKSGSPLLCTGTYTGRNRDFGGGAVFKQGCTDIGAWAESQRSRFGAIETRTTIETRNN